MFLLVLVLIPMGGMWRIPPVGMLVNTLCGTSARPTRRSPMPERGYSATKDQLDTRLSRIEGQVRGIRGMVEEDRYCIDVLTQINAVQAALDKVALGLLDGHARHCLAGGHGGPTDPDDQADELMGAVGRLLSR